MIYALLIFLLVCTSVCLYVSIKKNFELSDKLDTIAERVEICLDTLDECQMRIDKKSKLEVFYDDPVVKELIQDMKIARDSVIFVAKDLYETTNSESDEDS